MAVRSSRTSSARCLSVASGTSPCSTRVMVWVRLSTSATTGFSVWAGKVSMRSTAALMSSRTRRVSASSFSSAMTVPMPSWAVERILSMPSMPAMASSTRMQTPSSTSAGAAPR